MKRAERAKRFGLDDKDISSLDSALPERSRKRGRDRPEGEANRPNKRQSLDRRQGGRRRGRGGHDGGGRDSGREGGRDGAQRDVAPKRDVLGDPIEKAKAEKRAARFASN